MQDAATFPILRPRQQRHPKILPKKQTHCSECGEPIRVYLNGVTNPKAKHLIRGNRGGVYMKHHDLCQFHFQVLLLRFNHV